VTDSRIGFIHKSLTAIKIAAATLVRFVTASSWMFATVTTNLPAWQIAWAIPLARAVQSEFQFLCLPDRNLLFGERGFPTNL
jgi:hypothetical protein